MTPRRFYALDILRSCCILVITFYHVWETGFGQATMIFTPAQSLYGVLTPFFWDYWSYSGLILTFISFFLIGHSLKRLNWQRYLMILVGFIGMLTHSQIDVMKASTWEWNLYGYLLIGLFVVQLIPSKKWMLSVLIIISLGLLAIPIDAYQALKSHLSELGGQIIIGDLDATKTVGWSLLPWLSLPILGFSIGRFLQQLPATGQPFKGFKFEWQILLLLAAILVLFFPLNQNFSYTPTGFYYYVFSGSPWFFWSRFLVILLWLRLSWLQSVNEFLGGFAWIRGLSRLSWNRHFGLCYFVQFAFLPLAAPWAKTFSEYPRTMDLFWVFIVIATELSTRVLLRRFEKIAAELKI